MGHKVVINSCYGGFGLSEAAVALYNAIAVIEGMDAFESDYDIARHCPVLVRVVEELGDAASADYADLCIVQIPGDRYKIREYDGYESIQTPESIRWTVIE